MLINSSTRGACARGIAGVNEFDQDPRQLCLVLDKASQLKERPRVVLPPLTPANRYPVTNTTQVFQSDTPVSVFGLCNNSLTDSVIDVSNKPSLFTRTLLKQTFGCLRIFGLKFSSYFSMTFPETVDLTAGVSLPIGVGGDIDDTKVNAEKLFGVSHGRFFHLAGLEKIECTISVDEVSLPHKVMEKNQLPFSSNEGNPEPSVKSPNRDESVGHLPGEDTLVIGNTAMFIEGAPGGAASLISIRHLSQDSHHNLGREAEPTAEVVVEKVVQVILAKGLRLPSTLADIVGGIIHTLKRLLECLILLAGGCQLYLRDQLHRYIIAYSSRLDQKGGLAHSSAA